MTDTTSLSIKQGDTWPPIKATLKETNEAGELVPIKTLASAHKILFVMKSESKVVEGTCTVVGTEGEVEYTFAVGDTSTIGTYQVEFQIEWETGAKYQTISNSGYDQIVIGARLAAAN